jgi:hypothetical protein
MEQMFGTTHSLKLILLLMSVILLETLNLMNIVNLFNTDWKGGNADSIDGHMKLFSPSESSVKQD